MTYPNAHTGLKKVLIAEIFILIATVLAAVAAFGAAFGSNVEQQSAEISDKSFAIAGTATIVMGILMVIAFIINLVGLKQAGKDHPYFQLAFVFTIIGIVVAVLQGFFKEGAVGTYLQLATQLVSIFITVFVIYGIILLARKLRADKLAMRGYRLMAVITIILVVSLVMNIVAKFAGNSNGGLTVMGIISIVGVVLALISYILYIALLAGAVKTFKNN